MEVTLGSVSVIVAKGELLRKINFPKYVIVVSNSFAALINLAINFIVIAIFMHFDHVPFSLHDLFILPFILELFILSLSMAFFLSALYVKYRDVTYIWEVCIQGGFYATPILYPLTRIPHEYAKFLILNPLAQIIQDARHVMVTPQTQTISTVYGGDKWIWLIPLGLTLLVVIAGSLYFRSRSKYFAEEI